MFALLRPFLPHIAAVAAIVGVVWYLDHRGYERARKDAEQERVVTALMLTRATRDVEKRLADRMDANARQTAGQIGAIEAVHRTVIQPTITKELTRETRFTDPALGIPDSVRREVNRAIAAVACTATPDGGISCPLPDASPARDD